jgi:hypothetical protein
MKELVGVPLPARSLPFVFGVQALAKPSATVSFHCSLGFADRAQAEVVGPSDHLPVELCDYLFDGLLSCASSSRFANRLTDAFAPGSWTESCLDRLGPSSASSTDQSYPLESRTSLPVAYRPASSSRSPSVKMLLRHENIATSSEIYGNLGLEAKRRVQQRLVNFVKQQMPASIQ